MGIERTAAPDGYRACAVIKQALNEPQHSVGNSTGGSLAQTLAGGLVRHLSGTPYPQIAQTRGMRLRGLIDVARIDKQIAAHSAPESLEIYGPELVPLS